MSTLFPRTIQAEHRTGSFVRGDWGVTTVENFTFTGSVQPLTGKETEFLPENRRDTGLVKIYSNESNITSTSPLTLDPRKRRTALQALQRNRGMHEPGD